MYAKDFLIKKFPVLKNDDNISTAIKLFDNTNEIIDLPVFDKNDYLGIIKRNDVLKHPDIIDNKLALNTLDINYNKIFTYKNQHIFSIIKDANNHNLQTIAVLNNKKELTGLINIKDIYLYMSNTYSMQQEGGIIVLKMRHIDYSLILISQIIEYEKKLILAIWTSEAEENDQIYVSIKLNSIYLDNLIACFEKNGYEIHSAYPYKKDESKYEPILKFLDY